MRQVKKESEIKAKTEKSNCWEKYNNKIKELVWYKQLLHVAFSC